MADYDPSDLQAPFTSSARPGDFQRDPEGENYRQVEGSLRNLLIALILGLVGVFLVFGPLT